MTSPQESRKNRLLNYNRGVIIRVDDKEIPLSRKSAALSLLLNEALQSPDAEEDVKNWDEKKLDTEPLMEVVIPINLFSFPVMTIIRDYLHHFNGDVPNNQWEQKFIQDIISTGSSISAGSAGDSKESKIVHSNQSDEKGINRLIDVLSAANYLNIPSLIKLITEYVKMILKSNDIESITSRIGPFHLSSDIISMRTELIVDTKNIDTKTIDILNSKYSGNFSIVLFDDGHYFASNDHFRSSLTLAETAINFPNKIKSGTTIIETCAEEKLMSCYRIISTDNKKYFFGWIISSTGIDKSIPVDSKSTEIDKSIPVERKIPTIANYEDIIPPPNRLDTFKLFIDVERKTTVTNSNFMKAVNEIKEVIPPSIVYLKRIKYLTPKIPKSLIPYGTTLRDKLIIKTLLSFKSFPIDLIPMIMRENTIRSSPKMIDTTNQVRYIPKEYHYVPEHIIKIEPFRPIYTSFPRMLSVGKYAVILHDPGNIAGFNIYIGYIIETVSPYRMWGLKIPYTDSYAYGNVIIDKLIKIDDHSFVTQHAGEKRSAAIWDIRMLDMKTGTRDKITILGFRPNIPVLQPKYIVKPETDEDADDLESNIIVNTILPGYVYTINTLRDVWGHVDEKYVNLSRISVNDGSIKKVKIEANRSNVRAWSTEDGKIIVSPSDWKEGRNIIKVLNWNLEEINPSAAELKIIDEHKFWIPPPARTDYKYKYNEEDFYRESRKNSITIINKITEYPSGSSGSDKSIPEVKITFPKGRVIFKAELFENGFIAVTSELTELPSPTRMYRYSVTDNQLVDLGCSGVDFIISPDTKKIIVLNGYSGYPEIWR